MGPYLIQPLMVNLDIGLIAMKEYFTAYWVTEL